MKLLLFLLTSALSLTIVSAQPVKNKDQDKIARDLKLADPSSLVDVIVQFRQIPEQKHH